MNEIKYIDQKLKIGEYAFEIDGEDILKAHLIYRIGTIETTSYVDEIKNEIIEEPLLDIEINGTNGFENEAFVSFDLPYLSIEYLNTLPKTPTDITKFLYQSHAFIKKPNEKNSESLYFELQKNDDEDIYRNYSSLWVSKIKENEFIFKLSVPNTLFTYFKLIYEEEQ